MATITGKDCQTFIAQWVYTRGIVRLHGSFVFNRKRNMVELEIKQDHSSTGTMKYIVQNTIFYHPALQIVL